MTAATPELWKCMQTIIAIAIAALLFVCAILFVLEAKNGKTQRSKKVDLVLAILTAIGAIAAIILAWR